MYGTYKRLYGIAIFLYICSDFTVDVLGPFWAVAHRHPRYQWEEYAGLMGKAKVKKYQLKIQMLLFTVAECYPY